MLRKFGASGMFFDNPVVLRTRIQSSVLVTERCNEGIGLSNFSWDGESSGRNEAFYFAAKD